MLSMDLLKKKCKLHILFILYLEMNIIILYVFYYSVYDKKKKTLDRLKDQLTKLEVQATDKEENKEIALGTSKLNYLDPRITVAW